MTSETRSALEATIAEMKAEIGTDADDNTPVWSRVCANYVQEAFAPWHCATCGWSESCHDLRRWIDRLSALLTASSSPEKDKCADIRGGDLPVSRLPSMSSTGQGAGHMPRHCGCNAASWCDEHRPAIYQPIKAASSLPAPQEGRTGVADYRGIGTPDVSAGGEVEERVSDSPEKIGCAGSQHWFNGPGPCACGRWTNRLVPRADGGFDIEITSVFMWPELEHAPQEPETEESQA